MSYQHKRSSVVGKVPVAADFKEGQILVNIADGALYLLDAGGTVRSFDNRAVIDALLLDKLDKTATAANSLQLGGETAAQWQARINNAPSLGVGQTWQTVSRSQGTAYQNTESRPIEVKVIISTTSGTLDCTLEISSNGASFDVCERFRTGQYGSGGGTTHTLSVILPLGWYYRFSGSSSLNNPTFIIKELR